MATDVNNRSLFKKKNQEARNALKKMGGIMGSSEELMNAVMGGAPSATVEKMTGQGMMNPVPFQPIIPSGKPMSPPQMRMQPQMGQPPQMNMPGRRAASGGVMDVYPSNYFIGGLLAKGVRQGAKGIGSLFERLNRAPASKPFAGFRRDPKTGKFLPGQIKNTKTYRMGQAIKDDAVLGGIASGTGKITGLPRKAFQKAPITTSVGGAAGLGILGGSLFGGGEEPGVPDVPREQGPTAQEREAAKIRAMQGFAMAAGTSPFASRNIAQGMLYGLEAEERRQKEPDALFDQVYITRLQELLSQTDPETGQQLSFQQANQGAIDTASRIAPLARKAVDITEDRLNVPTIRTRSEYDKLEPGQKYRDGTRDNMIRTKPLEEPEVETT